jgi:multisubunit Na+/H+ antiporter MnhF subunit
MGQARPLLLCNHSSDRIVATVYLLIATVDYVLLLQCLSVEVKQGMEFDIYIMIIIIAELQGFHKGE